MKKNIVPDGTRDLFGRECIIRGNLINDINKIFHNWGYEEIITPTLEFYETFSSEPQCIREEEVYKFFDNKGRILALRPDMTVPISRVVATKLKDYEIPIRLRYEANVYRVNESLVGKRNEFTDCGVELIGIEKGNADLEILVMALDILKSLKVNDYRLEIGDVNVFYSAINSLNISNEEKEILADLIEKKSLKALDDFLLSITLSSKEREFFKELPLMFGSGTEVFNKCKRLIFNKEMENSVRYLEDIYNKFNLLALGEFITFDLGMIPRLNYYTGIIFRGFIEGAGSSILSGGRYDNLLGSFGRSLKAIGFSINIDSLISLVDNYNIKAGDEFKVYFNQENEIEALNIAAKIRARNNKVIMMPEDKINEIIVKKGAEDFDYKCSTY